MGGKLGNEVGRAGQSVDTSTLDQEEKVMAVNEFCILRDNVLSIFPRKCTRKVFILHGGIERE